MARSYVKTIAFWRIEPLSIQMLNLVFEMRNSYNPLHFPQRQKKNHPVIAKLN